MASKKSRKPRAVPTVATPAQAAAPASSVASKRTTWLAGAALVVLVFVAYLPALPAEFIWDDDQYVTSNKTLTSLDGLWRMWTVFGAVPQYYPLVHSTFWVEYHLWGLNPHGFHAVNIALHAAGTVLLWRLLVYLKVPGAWFAAALFGLHPVEVESVAWITERKNVLSLPLTLGAMLCYFHYAPVESAATTAPNARPRLWYAAALVLFVLALLSKTVVATMPAVLLVIYWWKRGRITAADVKPLLPFFAAAIGLGLITAWMEVKYVGAQGDDWDLTGVQRLLLAGRVIWFYASKVYWPTSLSFFYPRWSIDPHQWWEWLFPAGIVALIVGLWAGRGIIGRGPLAAVLIFCGVLVPALGFFNVYPFRYSYVADHFQYHASIALLALFAATAATLAAQLPSSRRKLLFGVGAVLLLMLGTLSFCQTFVYYDLDTLYQDTIDKNPGSWAAYSNLAAHLMGLGQIDQAAVYAQKAVDCNPNVAEVQSNVGFTLLMKAKNDPLSAAEVDKIVTHFRTALELNPRLHLARKGLAFSLIKGARFDEAQLVLEDMLRRKPNDHDALFGMGRLYEEKGDLEKSQDYFEQALRQRPSNPGTMTALERVQMRRGGQPTSNQPAS